MLDIFIMKIYNKFNAWIVKRGFKMEFLCEYTVDKKREGLYGLLKPFIISLWFIIPLIVMGVGVAVGSALGGLGGLFGILFFIVPSLTLGFAKFFAASSVAYGEVAFEYTIVSGEMSFAKIYGNRFRREWFKLKISDMEKCAPFTADAEAELARQSFAHVYKAISSPKADYIYYAVYKNAKNERCLVFFQVIKKSLKMIKGYYPATVMTNLPF